MFDSQGRYHDSTSRRVRGTAASIERASIARELRNNRDARSRLRLGSEAQGSDVRAELARIERARKRGAPAEGAEVVRTKKRKGRRVVLGAVQDTADDEARALAAGARALANAMGARRDDQRHRAVRARW